LKAPLRAASEKPPAITTVAIARPMVSAMWRRAIARIRLPNLRIALSCDLSPRPFASGAERVRKMARLIRSWVSQTVEL
jgi:hypothetical protein